MYAKGREKVNKPLGIRHHRSSHQLQPGRSRSGLDPAAVAAVFLGLQMSEAKQYHQEFNLNDNVAAGLMDNDVKVGQLDRLREKV